jgi:hypothetical protein
VQSARICETGEEDADRNEGGLKEQDVLLIGKQIPGFNNTEVTYEVEHLSADITVSEMYWCDNSVLLRKDDCLRGFGRRGVGLSLRSGLSQALCRMQQQ